MSPPQWYYRLMRLNMASVPHYYNQLPILPTLQTSCGTPIACNSSSLSPTEQRYAQIKTDWLSFMHSTILTNILSKADVVVHCDHNPLQIILKHPLADAPRRLQSMMLTHQCYRLTVNYHKGSTLHIADTLSQAPLPVTSHKEVQDELVYHVELEAKHLDLSGFQDATLEESCCPPWPWIENFAICCWSWLAQWEGSSSWSTTPTLDFSSQTHFAWWAPV